MTADPARLPHWLALIDVLVDAGRLEAAAELLANAPARFAAEPALAARRARLVLVQIGSLEMPEDALARRHLAAARDFLAGRHGEALEGWLGVVREQPGFGRGAARAARSIPAAGGWARTGAREPPPDGGADALSAWR